MRGLNKVTLIGNLGKDPESQTLEGNVPVAKFSLATTEAFKDKNGQNQYSTDWHTVVLWRSLAELAQTYLAHPRYATGNRSVKDAISRQCV